MLLSIRYCLLADFESYVECQERVSQTFMVSEREEVRRERGRKGEERGNLIKCNKLSIGSSEVAGHVSQKHWQYGEIL